MTLGEQVVEPLIVHGIKDVDLKARAAELLSQVGLGADFSDRYPHQLSGGQARRVGVARALALEPGLIIADEPTAGLDVSIQGDVLNLLNEIQERTGVAILIITHNMSVVRHCADPGDRAFARRGRRGRPLRPRSSPIRPKPTPGR